MTRVGFAHNTAGGSAGTSSCSVSYSATGGNTLLVAVCCAGGSATLSDGVNTYAQDNFQPTVGGGHALVFRASQITGGALTITATKTGIAENFAVFVVEYSGLDPSPTDGTNSNSGNDQAVSSGAFNTTNGADLIFSMATNPSQVFTAAGGATIIDSAAQAGGVVAAVKGCVAERFVTVSGSYGGTFTIPSSAEWGCIAVAYKAAVEIADPIKYQLGLLGIATADLGSIQPN